MAERRTNWIRLVWFAAIAFSVLHVRTPVARAQTHQPVPYTTNFEGGTPPGWTSVRLNTAPTLTTFLGNYGRNSNGSFQSTSLRVRLTPGTSYTVIFDLYMIDSWDASHPAQGPDWFVVIADGQTILRETFESANVPDEDATYPGSLDQSGNWFGAPDVVDTIHRSIAINFTARVADTSITFRGEANEPMASESWGIDNVRVVASSEAGAYIPRFSDASRHRRFRFRSTTSTDWGSSPIWADFNRDGYLDALVTGTTTRLLQYNPANGRLNSRSIGVNFARQACVADFDNDGDLDLFGFSDFNTERFLLSSSGASFTNVRELGTASSSNNRAAAFLDMDRDGYVDLLLASASTNWLAINSGIAQGAPQPAPNATTTPITFAMYGPSWINGASDVGAGGSIATGDINNDQIPDVIRHIGVGRVYLSQPDGTYAAANTAIRLPVTSERVGMQLADIDNDDDLDLVVANPTGPMQLWINSNGTFEDRAAEMGLVAGVATRSVAVGDYTNDGRLDVYAVAANGEGNVMFRGGANGLFAIHDDRARVMNELCLDAVMGDYDLDGDLDLAITTFNTLCRLYDNITNSGRHLTVLLVGLGRDEGVPGWPRDGSGVTVRLYSEQGAFLARREPGAARGLASAEPLHAHFGGIDPGATYQVGVWSRGREYRVRVTPATATSVIGPTSISQMLTINEADLKSGLRVVRWREVAATE